MDPTPFRDLPVVKGERPCREPAGLEHFDGLWAMLDDPEGILDSDPRPRVAR